MPEGILVVIEQRDGQVKGQSLQTLTKARELTGSVGGKLCALVIGSGIAAVTEQLKAYGPDVIFLAENDNLADYKNASYAETVASVAGNMDPKLILVSATSLGKDLGPLIAAKLACGITTDITALDLDGDDVVLRKPIYAGKCFANFKVKSFPVVLSLRPNVFEASEADSTSDAEVSSVDTVISEQDHADVSYIEPESAELDVAEASIIVSGGRGLKEPENFEHVRTMAEALGAAVGASRAVVDADWISHEHQVGQTGKTVSPNLYVALGISGAIQHLAGMSSSKLIAAINKDADAPIFKVADFGIIGDLFSVIEKINERIGKE